MKINNIKALDYRADGDRLLLVLAETTMEAVSNMDAAVIRVETDDGVSAECFAGYALRSVTYNMADGSYTAIMVRGVEAATARALDALCKDVDGLQAPNEDRDALLVDLDYRMTLMELEVI